MKEKLPPKNCLACKTVFQPTRKHARQKFCCKKCGDTSRKFGEEAPNWKGGWKKSRSCVICAKEFFVHQSAIDRGRAKYCSLKCRGLGTSGSKCPLWRNKDYKDPDYFKKAYELSKTECEKVCMFCNLTYLARKDTKSYTQKFCSYDCCWKHQKFTTKTKAITQSKIEYKRRQALQVSGATNYWRICVYKRDNFTCQHCGLLVGKNPNGKLHAHHILAWAKYPELRWEISNGITLCPPCHKKEHRRLKVVAIALRMSQDPLSPSPA